MTWLAFIFGILLGVLVAGLWLSYLDLDDENVLDSEEEYVDNTPTFR